MEQKKFGWTAWGIIGFIFAPIGAIHLSIGIFLWKNNLGNQEVFRYTFGGMGALFLLLGLFFLSLDLRRRYLLRRAYNGGYCIDVPVKEIVEVRSVNVNHAHPFVVVCSHTDSSGETHEYRSRYLYRDPTDLLTGGTVPVYIDRMDERIGYVDVDWIDA